MMKTQIPGQITLFEYMHKDTPLGYIKDEDIASFKGNEIPYGRLGEYVGKKVLYSMPRQGTVDYKVILITSFHKDCENVYGPVNTGGFTTLDYIGEKYGIIGKASKIGYSDDNRKHKENSWVGELYCTNGRYKGQTNFQSCMYELA